MNGKIPIHVIVLSGHGLTYILIIIGQLSKIYMSHMTLSSRRDSVTYSPSQKGQRVLGTSEATVQIIYTY